MATTEEISLIRIQTEGAESIGQLKENVKALKEALDTTTIGTEEYQEALNLLKVNQNALKDAMYATSASLEDVMKSASGTSETYNGLVHRMAAMKEELRNTDISTEEGKKRFDELAQSINGVNDKLKELDKAQGNYQRNVGNYESAFKGMAKYTDAFDKGLKATTGGLGAVKGGFDALSASPAVATFAILVSSAVKLAEALKDNEDASAALKKGMEALKPVMDFVSGIISKLVDYVVDIVEKVSEFVGSNGLFKKIIDGVVGVGNAIVQFVLAPYEAVIQAVRILKEEGVKGLRDAGKAIDEELNNGIAFKKNFKAGETIVDTIISGAKSKKEDVKKAGKEAGKETAYDFTEGLDQALKEWERKRNEKIAFAQEQENEWQALVKADEDAFQAELDAYFAAEEEMMERQKILREMEEEEKEKQLEKEKKIAEARKQTLFSVANATSDILSSMADMYEADEENASKNANKVKALRIASATIDTISGAIGAFMQASETIPPPYGQIVGGIQAAVVTAAGMANIAKMKGTKVGTSGSSGSASVTAPSIPTEISQVRNVTSASEEERLNDMASSQRVYILSSDIEASQSARRVQTAESSF